LAAAHDLHHATDAETHFPATPRDAALYYPSKFSYHASWNSIDWVWGPSGHPYTLPFQAHLEQRWGAVGVDPRKVNDIGPSFRREPGKEHVTADAVVNFPEEQSLAMDAETEPAGTLHPTVLPATDDHLRTRPASSKSGSSTSPSYEERNDYGTSYQSTHTRIVAPLPRRSSEMLSASVLHMSKQIHATPWSERTRRSMSRDSQLSSPESSFRSDDDYIESSSGATKRRTGVGSRNSRGAVGRRTAVLKDTAPAPTPRATPSLGTHRRYPCPHKGCPQVCDRPHDLDRHLESKAHKVPSYKCLACSRMFTRQDPLKRHMDGRCQVLKAERQARSKAKRPRIK